MHTQMKTLGNAGDAITNLNGWEIGGIVAGLLVLAAAAWMFPEFLRYMKIRHM